MPATNKDKKKLFLSMVNILKKFSDSTIRTATNTKIAAITANGIYLKYGIKITEIKAIEILLMVDDALLFAPVLMLSEVLARAAVAGIPPIKPDPILANPSANISFLLLCLVLVMPSAILAEIMVSRIAIRAIARAGTITKVPKVKCGICNNICGMAPNFDSNVCNAKGICFIDERYPRIIPDAANTITPGNFGNFLTSAKRATKKIAKVMKVGQEIKLTCLNDSMRLSMNLVWLGRLFNPSAKLNSLKAIINATPRVNPCKALAGINTKYRSSLNKYAIITNIPAIIARAGR